MNWNFVDQVGEEWKKRKNGNYTPDYKKREDHNDALFGYLGHHRDSRVNSQYHWHMFVDNDLREPVMQLKCNGIYYQRVMFGPQYSTPQSYAFQMEQGLNSCWYNGGNNKKSRRIKKKQSRSNKSRVKRTKL